MRLAESSNGAIVSGMTSTRWERIQSLFEGACRLEADQRSGFLEATCDDPELRALVAEMLEVRETGDLLIASRLLTHDPDRRAGVVGVSATDDPTVGRQFGDYRAGRRLGRGGSADVYWAVNVSGDGPSAAAIKILRDKGRGDQMVRRFGLERAILERLRHPNIASVLDGGVTSSGQHYLVMDYVDGMLLSDHVREHTTEPRRRLELFAEVCEAVRFAHGRDVLHRDLKTSNVMVTTAGHAVLLDFGIAKLLGPSDGPSEDLVTPAGVRLLTPGNAAPERVLGHAATVETDVYGLGLILYELMSGQPALDPTGMSWIEWETTVLQVIPAPLSEAVGTGNANALAVQLDRVVARALEKRPEERYRSVDALADEVAKVIEGLRS